MGHAEPPLGSSTLALDVQDRLHHLLCGSRSARVLYARWGFEDLPFDPRRSVIIRMVGLELNSLDW